jgi:hypothetical protein
MFCNSSAIVPHVFECCVVPTCFCGNSLQVDALRTVVGQLEVSTAAAEAEYNRQLARNKDELAALRQSRGSELTGMLVRGHGGSKHSRRCPRDGCMLFMPDGAAVVSSGMWCLLCMSSV